MASEVDICNIALAYLGDAANLQSISPPDGSAQADHAARFYPIARDALLEMHDWSFCMTRGTLALLTNDPASGWAFCYAQPANFLNAISVLDPAAQDDSSSGILMPGSWRETPYPMGGVYTTQPFALETLADGTSVVLTNQQYAVMRYTQRIIDTNRFSPTFTKCLTRSLASMLAGAVIKGDAGDAASARQEMIAFGRDGKSGLFGIATSADAGDKKSTIRDRQQVPWINGR